MASKPNASTVTAMSAALSLALASAPAATQAQEQAPSPKAPAAKPKAPPAPSMSPEQRVCLANVAVVGWQSARSHASAIAAILKAGGFDQKPVRAQFMLGFMAAKLWPDMDALNDTLIAATKEAMKLSTPETVKHNAAARKAWSRLLQDADVKPTETRGTKAGTPRATKVGAKDAAKAEAPKLPEMRPMSPRVKDAAEGRILAGLWGTSAQMLLNKNTDRMDNPTRTFWEAVISAHKALKATTA